MKKYYAITTPRGFVGIVDDIDKMWDYTRGVSGFTSATFNSFEEASAYMEAKDIGYKVEISDKEILPSIFVVTVGNQTGIFRDYKSFARAIKFHPAPEHKKFTEYKKALSYWETNLKKIVKEEPKKKTLVAVSEIRKKDKGVFNAYVNFLESEEGISYCVIYETPKFDRFKDIGHIKGPIDRATSELLVKVILNASLNSYKKIKIYNHLGKEIMNSIKKASRKHFELAKNPFVRLDEFESVIDIEYKPINRKSKNHFESMDIINAYEKIRQNMAKI